MPAFLTARAGARLVPITPLAKDKLEGWLLGRPEAEAAWVRAAGFKAEPGRYHLYVSLACPWAHR
ncbi:MAG: hypothetical protein IIC53_05210, partial [Proteobacteria bacterium]|nr:hypothetical protein [Pseudomonadota bacterium]